MEKDKKLSFKFQGRTYEFTDLWEETCLNDSAAFQLEQFQYLVSIGEFNTLTNRINNQLKFGYLKEISYIK
jgi:hypothetical protein